MRLERWLVDGLLLAAECGDNFTDSDIFLSVGYLFRLGPQISDTKTTVVGTVMEEWRLLANGWGETQEER